MTISGTETDSKSEWRYGGFTCIVGKKGEEKKKKKRLKGKKVNWFYVFVDFVWYKV
jgi:hypothetical protein